jgi:hypothetical protein
VQHILSKWEGEQNRSLTLRDLDRPKGLRHLRQLLWWLVRPTLTACSACNTKVSSTAGSSDSKSTTDSEVYSKEGIKLARRSCTGVPSADDINSALEHASEVR